jgi:hypothetical protein
MYKILHGFYGLEAFTGNIKGCQHCRYNVNVETRI